jgi:hypothetical protein
LKTLISFLLIIVFKTATAQGDQKILWSEDRPLTWNDFQGNIDESSKFAANTYYGEDYDYKWQQLNGHYTITFNVKCYVVKDKSWTKTDKQTSYLLKHEQIHFDISEFFARQLAIAFSKYSFTSNFKAEMIQIHQSILDQRVAMELLYDEQTDHSLNKLLQAKWELYIANLLANNYQLSDALSMAPR